MFLGKISKFQIFLQGPSESSPKLPLQNTHPRLPPRGRPTRLSFQFLQQTSRSAGILQGSAHAAPVLATLLWVPWILLLPNVPVHSLASVWTPAVSDMLQLTLHDCVFPLEIHCTQYLLCVFVCFFMFCLVHCFFPSA